jgi:hypothetical protein
MRQLKEAQAALEEATQACDEAFRAWVQAPAPARDRSRDREALEAAARFFSDAQRRLVHAQVMLRHAPPADPSGAKGPDDKAWGSH